MGLAVRPRETAALQEVERLYPDGIGEAASSTGGGAEIACIVRGKCVPVSVTLSPDESGSAFSSRDVRAARRRRVPGAPYVSPDTKNWVISNSSPLPHVHGRSPAFVHFEISIESFRRQAAAASDAARLQVVDTHSGQVIFDAADPQRAGERLALGRARGRSSRQPPSATMAWCRRMAAAPPRAHAEHTTQRQSVDGDRRRPPAAAVGARKRGARTARPLLGRSCCSRGLRSSRCSRATSPAAPPRSPAWPSVSGAGTCRRRRPRAATTNSASRRAPSTTSSRRICAGSRPRPTASPAATSLRASNSPRTPTRWDAHSQR